MMPGLKSWTAASLVAISAVAALVAQGGQARAGSRSAGHADSAGRRVPAGHDGVAPGALPAPEQPPPNIVDYRPKSTVVADRAHGAEGEVPGRRHPQPHRGHAATTSNN